MLILCRTGDSLVWYLLSLHLMGTVGGPQMCPYVSFGTLKTRTRTRNCGSGLHPQVCLRSRGLRSANLQAASRVLMVRYLGDVPVGSYPSAYTEPNRTVSPHVLASGQQRAAGISQYPLTERSCRRSTFLRAAYTSRRLVRPCRLVFRPSITTTTKTFSKVFFGGDTSTAAGLAWTERLSVNGSSTMKSS